MPHDSRRAFSGVSTRRFWLTIALAAAVCTVSAPAALTRAAEPAQADFYVAPNGSDSWSGKLAAPNAQKTDGPFATLERARDAVRALRNGQQKPRPSADIKVWLRGGVYPRTQPLVFRPEDSGNLDSPNLGFPNLDALNPGSPHGDSGQSSCQKVIYESYPGERAVISGGRAISGWTPGEGGLWKVDLPEVKAGKWHFRQLFVNGQRRFRPRLPKEGFCPVAGAPRIDTTGWVGVGPEAKNQWDLRTFRYRPGDLRKEWKNLEDVEVVVLQFWMESRLRIQNLDEKNHVVLFTGGSWRTLTWSEGYYVENVFEGLDAPGTWYLDRKQGTLYYRPLPGEDMAKAQVIAPAARQLVRFEGDAKSGRLVRSIVLSRLGFEHADWTLGAKGHMCEQSEINVPAAIHADGAVGCAVENCDLAHLGTWGIELRRGCRSNRIQGNQFRDLGAGAVKIGEPENCADAADETHSTRVTDNRIADCGQVYLGASGIWVGQSSRNLVAHNEISGPLMWAISVGWTWSYFPLQRARDNVVEQNHCHHVGTGVLGSHCAIYALGTSPGTVIRNNYIHHVYHSPHWRGAAEGIILDNGCCGILVENNVVHDADAGGFGTNFNCFGNIVQNNVFAYGKEYQLTVYGDMPTGKPQPKGEIFARNIVIWKEGPLIKERDWPNFSTLWDYNLYWHEGGAPVTFLKYTFDQWKAKELDTHSIVADPRFVDPARGNFALRPDSPAWKLGFQPIDLSAVGPRQAAKRP